MPYIKSEDRDRLVKYVNRGGDLDEMIILPERINNAGELQYVIAEIINELLSQKQYRYQDLNDIMGALAGAQMEFYRKVVAEYEDEKEKINGSVYE